MDVPDARLFAYCLLAATVALVGGAALDALSGAGALLLLPAAVLVLAALVFLDGYLA
ncbi:hypothetical protein [Halosegnis marinus]|uniref:Uncharacterized protein n=1 Tax=Halosegnis marinus TaxID=3034023 RepID=A0ABD5ZMP9_9EURY|nr:hypothetical protein [Halosegnis sp. DT85]